MFLDHPNIVKLYGFFDDSTHFYIVMEYMDGGNLFALIKKKKKLTEVETIEKLKEVCLGLKEMHDNSILHRDIKPENIVITNVPFNLLRT
jgi:serine/threonine protein kinase